MKVSPWSQPDLEEMMLSRKVKLKLMTKIGLGPRIRALRVFKSIWKDSLQRNNFQMNS